MTLQKSVLLPRIFLCLWVLSQLVVIVLASYQISFLVLSLVSSWVFLFYLFRSDEWAGAQLLCDSDGLFTLETRQGIRYSLYPEFVFLFHPSCIFLTFGPRFCLILPDMLSAGEYVALRYCLSILSAKKTLIKDQRF